MSKYFHNNTKLLILSGVLAGALVFSPTFSSLALAEGTEVTETTATAEATVSTESSAATEATTAAETTATTEAATAAETTATTEATAPAPPQQMTMAQLLFVFMILKLVGILELTLLSVHTALNTTEMPISLQRFQTIIRASLLMEIFSVKVTHW